MSEYKKNEKGFTMIEMIVSIFIIAMLSGIFLANYHYYNRTGNLNTAAQKLSNDLRRAQSYTMGLRSVDGAFPLGGWGIVLDNTAADKKIYYYLSGDANGDHVLENLETLSQDKINFPAGISIESLIVNGGPGTVNKINIIYEPPMPTGWICINSGSSCDTESQYNSVTVVLTNGIETKSIIANIFGLVDVVN